jgi:hypothetical protein
MVEQIMDLFYNNYKKIFYKENTWHLEITSSGRPVKSFYEECRRTAELWYNNKIGDIHILLNGFDSEFVVCIFLSLKIKVIPVICNLWTKNYQLYNKSEVKYYYDFCKYQNINPLIFDLNLDQFLSDSNPSYYQSSDLWVASQIDGTILLAGDCPYIELDKKTNIWNILENEICYNQLDYWQNKKINGTPFFLTYTAEQLLSFLIDPAIKRLVDFKIENSSNSNSVKIYVYTNKSFFNLSPRTDSINSTNMFSNNPEFLQYSYNKLVDALYSGTTFVSEKSST